MEQRMSAHCFVTLPDGSRCNQPAFFVAPDGTAPACREHASAESKFTGLATLTALLLRSLDARPHDARWHGIAPLGQRMPEPAELIAELRRIFGADFAAAERG